MLISVRKGNTVSVPLKAHVNRHNGSRYQGWIEPENNPYGIPLASVRPIMQRMMGAAHDADVTARFLALRSDDGTRYTGQGLDSRIEHACTLVFPGIGPLSDGPVFRAETMDDKWDIFLYNRCLYFVRSWTGRLMHRASVEFDGGTMLVRAVDSNPEVNASSIPVYSAHVNFLVRSHLLKEEFPAPFLRGELETVEDIAMHLFSAFGRYCVYGCYDDDALQLLNYPMGAGV